MNYWQTVLASFTGVGLWGLLNMLVLRYTTHRRDKDITNWLDELSDKWDDLESPYEDELKKSTKKK